ncbi:thiol:disulfide interchange protein [Citrobacter freundii]|nr:thiol:disulfide interchange protein [Citrobacter freundii]
MNVTLSRTGFSLYSFFLIVISSLITVLYYHLFIFNTFSTNGEKNQTFKKVSVEEVINSPIQKDNSIIEVISYGCHYCAANEDNVSEISRSLPLGSSFEKIHIVDNKSALASYAPIFATLTEMGVEEKYRDSAYNAIIIRNIDLTDEKLLTSWLEKNNINTAEYKSASQSDAVKKRLAYMAEVTKHYDIKATPMFIINKRYVVAQDREFPEFSEYILELFTEGK